MTQPFNAPSRKSHVEQDLCSLEYASQFAMGEHASRPVWSLSTLLGARFQLNYTVDDFAEEYCVGPLIISNDVLNGWILFFNHNQDGYIHISDLSRLITILQLIRDGDIPRGISFLAAAVLDYIGMTVSRGHWAIGPLHIHCDDAEGWSWAIA